MPSVRTHATRSERAGAATNAEVGATVSAESAAADESFLLAQRALMKALAPVQPPSRPAPASGRTLPPVRSAKRVAPAVTAQPPAAASGKAATLLEAGPCVATGQVAGGPAEAGESPAAAAGMPQSAQRILAGSLAATVAVQVLALRQDGHALAPWMRQLLLPPLALVGVTAGA